MTDELVDVVDERDLLTGRKILKSEAHRIGALHRAAHVLLYDRHHRVLLQQRASGKIGNPGLWDISVAGHVTAGETAREAAARELEEELGIIVAPSRLKRLLKGRGSYTDPTRAWRCEVTITAYALRTDLDVSRQRLQESEVAATQLIHASVLKRELQDPRIRERYVPHGQYWIDALDALSGLR